MALTVYTDFNTIINTVSVAPIAYEKSTPTITTANLFLMTGLKSNISNNDTLTAVYKLKHVIFNLSYVSGGIEMTSYNSGVTQTWNQQ
jgi:hypothetical protein